MFYRNYTLKYSRSYNFEKTSTLQKPSSKNVENFRKKKKNVKNKESSGTSIQ